MEAKKLDKDYEIRDQAHLMDAEGTSNEKPSEEMIKEALKESGYIASDIDVWFDNMFGFWRWTAEIKYLKTK